MTQPRFIHLRAHSEYSICDSVIRIDELVEKLAELNMPAMAITDQANLFAAVKFYKAALSYGIKPILGTDLTVSNPQHPEQTWQLTLFCQNLQGYRNLTELLSRCYLSNQQNGVPCLEKSWLTTENCQGLIALLNFQSELAANFQANSLTQAKICWQSWQKLFFDRLYIEISRTNRSGEKTFELSALRLAAELHLPIVATNDVRFLSSDDFEAHEARVCIYEGSVLSDPKRNSRYQTAQYLKSEQEMCKLFADLPSALQNTVEIAKRCNLFLELGKTYLPNYPTGDLSTEEFLTQQSENGLKTRLQILAKTADEEKIYWERLNTELAVINQMGFAGYFLIVADFIQWAKNNGVPVGPGRGSGAGSLVAYALGITDLDPLQYDLLFERFLNPERVSMPDFDIDFCMEGRDRVIEYVANKYGRHSVSQIITYGSMAAKAVVRDVGRVFGHPYGFVDKIAKLIPFELGITLEKALDQEAELKRRYDEEEEVKALLDLALKLEGLVRNAGKHAGGVVIAPSKLTDFTPLYCEADGQNLVSQFDKDDVEAVGLVKFDFLGLRTLTIIDWALQNITRHRQQTIDINLIPLDDATVFTLLKNGETTAVFQLESRGMKDLIKRLKPDCFEDIVALVALFRPGPLQSGMVDDFIQRKHGIAKIEYPHPALEPILKPTYGVILYQEQVMQIAQVLAGYTLGAADLLRRAMGKKKAEEMAQQRAIFTEGAVANGVDANVATHIFDLMEKFAGYGFNKSHSAAYALLSYQTAWLKVHYPAEFMAAVLSSDMDNTDKLVIFLEDAKRMGLKINPPNINQCAFQFTVTHDEGQQTIIWYGLGAVKGAGEAALTSVIEDRQQHGPFKELFDFCHRCDLRKVNKRVLEALVKGGAFDCFGENRATLFASLDTACQQADQHQQNHEAGQFDLFGNIRQHAEPAQHYVRQADWPLSLQLQYEKEILGWYLSGHPLNIYQHEIQKLAPLRIGELAPNPDKIVTIAGQLTQLRLIMTKRGDRMGIALLEDGVNKIDVTIFSEEFEKKREILQKDTILIAEGSVDHDDFTGGLRMVAKQIYSLSQARNLYARRLMINVTPENIQALVRNEVRELFGKTPGTCPIQIRYQVDDAMINCLFGQKWQIQPTDELLHQLITQFGAGAVWVEY